MTRSHAHRVVATLAIAGWILSLFLPTDLNPAINDGWPGYLVLMVGFLGFFEYQFGWLANPILLILMPLYSSLGDPYPKFFGISGILLLMLVLNAAFWNEAPFRSAFPPSMDGSGYYVWMLVMSGAGVAMSVRAVLDSRRL